MQNQQQQPQQHQEQQESFTVVMATNEVEEQQTHIRVIRSVHLSLAI